MRFLPFLAAALVTLGLYMFVFEREALFALAAGDIETAQSALQRAAEARGSGSVNQGEAEALLAARRGENATEEDKVRVVVMRSAATGIDNAVVMRGETEASRHVDVLSETSGRIVGEPLRRGEAVQSGDVLCELDPGTRQASLAEAEARLAEAVARRPEVAARVTEAEARLEEARINDNAAEQLNERGFASETQVASARAAISAAEAGVEAARAGLTTLEAQIQSAEAAVAAAREEIGRLTLHAPFDGILLEDTAETGALLQPGALCARIQQLDPIRLVGFVPEMEVGLIQEGARVNARLSTGTTLDGEVSHVARTADAATRTFRVEALVDNPDLSIRAGQTAEILIAARGVQAHFLPASALTLDDDGRLGVRVVDAESIARFRPVAMVRDTAEGVYVDGLGESAEVIVVGQDFVRDGVPVLAHYRDTDASAEEITP